MIDKQHWEPLGPLGEWESPTYDFVVGSFGYVVSERTSLGVYQGDNLWLLFDAATGQYGFLTDGYGSCSGCDTLQSMEGDLVSIENYRERLHDSIIWHSPDVMWQFLIGRDWRSQFYGGASEMEPFLTACLAHFPTPTFGQNALCMLRNPECDPTILADAVQEDGFDVLADGLRGDYSKYLTLRRLRAWLAIDVATPVPDDDY